MKPRAALSKASKGGTSPHPEARSSGTCRRPTLRRAMGIEGRRARACAPCRVIEPVAIGACRCSASSSSALAIAGDTGDPDDLAGAHVEGGVDHAHDAERVGDGEVGRTLEQRVAGPVLAFVDVQQNRGGPPVSSASSAGEVFTVSSVATISSAGASRDARVHVARRP